MDTEKTLILSFYSPSDIERLSRVELSRLAVICELHRTHSLPPVADLMHVISHRRRDSHAHRPRPRPVEPKTPLDAFRVINGVLHHYRAAEVCINGQWRLSEHVRECGPRVRVAGVLRHSSDVVRELTDPAYVADRPARSSKTRYKAQIRVCGRVVHIGMYDTPLERDLAVAAARKGVFPTRVKNHKENALQKDGTGRQSLHEQRATGD